MGTHAPTGHPNSFNLMQFLGEFGKIVCSRPPPPPVGLTPHLGEILDPPLLFDKVTGVVIEET